MPRRKITLESDELYHIANTSISDLVIFKQKKDFERMLNEINFYRINGAPCDFYLFNRTRNRTCSSKVKYNNRSEKLVDIIAYCIMPTHIHFILKQLIKNGISKFMGSISQSYTQYFNAKYKRKGPLWQGRFKNILIKDDNQFMHVTRYIHLNPVTAHLVDKPEDWKYSSYGEYIGTIENNKKICNFLSYLDCDSFSYAKFVNEQIEYQRELALIKKLILD